jgi:hypothetical protein
LKHSFIEITNCVAMHRQGYLLLGCPGPWHITIRVPPPAFWVTWRYGPGQAAGTTVSGPTPGSVRPEDPTRPGRHSGHPRGPGLSRGSGGVACDGRAITGLTAPASHGGPDLPPSREGSGAATCCPCRGAGLALPRACGWRPSAGHLSTYQHSMR